MKKRLRLLLPFLVTLISFVDLTAYGSVIYQADTFRIESDKSSGGFESAIKPPVMYLNLSTGLLFTSFFGNHPIINVTLGLREKKNRFNIAYEHRFGNSDEYYNILDNETLISTNAYNANYIGFEYQRELFRTQNHEFYTNTGIGTDWIVIEENDILKNNKIIGGLALNLGIGYTFYIKKKHGPNVEILYHFADFKNEGGTKIDKNSFLIRLSYNFGNDYIKDK